MSRLGSWLCTLLLFLVPSPAGAQPNLPGGSVKEKLFVQVEFGFNDIMPVERWAPVRFTITSPERHIVGMATLTYQQDGSQSLATSTPVTLTAGMPTPIDFFVCLPRSGAECSFTLREDNGKVLLRERYNTSSFGASSVDSFTPPSLVQERITILAIGHERLADAQSVWARSLYLPDMWNGYRASDQETHAEFEQQFGIASIAPEDAFASWAAYDGVAAIVAPASVVTSLPERARREILLWVQRGGRLIIQLDDASSAWRQWLPAGRDWHCFDVGDPRTMDVPDPLGALTQAHAKAAGFDSNSTLAVAASIPARPISLTQRGSAVGFQPLWSGSSESDAVIAVQGPFGFGSLVLIGFDPASLPTLPSRSGPIAAWGGVLESCVPIVDVTPDTRWRGYTWSSGATSFQSEAISSIVDSCVDAPGIRGSTLVLVVTLLCIFALAIGPFDAIFLKRRGWRHWSWLSATGWITVFSGVLLVVPLFQRDNNSEVGRVVVTDALLDETGAPLVSWKTGVTVSYAGRNGPIGPSDERSGAWWRGISPVELYFYGRPSDTLGPIRAMQGVVPGPDGARSSCLPRVPSQRVWTVRALLDSAPDPPPISARVERTTSGYELLLGQAPVEIVGGVRIQVGSRLWGPLTITPGSNTSLDRSLSLDARSVTAPRADQAKRPVAVLFDDRSLADLPNIDDHDRAIADMLASGRFALVALMYKSDQPDVPLAGADQTRFSGAVRLVVPIVDRASQESSP